MHAGFSDIYQHLLKHQYCIDEPFKATQYNLLLLQMVMPT